MKRFAAIFTVLLCACEPAPPADPVLRVGDVLAAGDTEGFLRATERRQFNFPQDHALHQGFRNEWWYLTGNLATADGRRFGYQVTFFASALRPESAEASSSTWDSDRIWMGHLALTDVAAGEHHAFERFSRENPGLAGAQLSPLKIWLDDWQLTGSDTNDTLPWTLRAAEADIALHLEMQTLKPPVLQGEEGLSQKSSEPGNASYYYSMTRLPTQGELSIDGETFAVTGNSWLDREWSTSALANDQTGWDWFSLQFDDGQELMYYQLRDTNGAAHANSQGNWTSVDARQTLVTPAQIELEELATWTSAQGVSYPTSWILRYAGKAWRIDAVMEDQQLDLSFVYWEGAVLIRDDSSGEEVGRGYLEMVRQ